VTGDLSHELRTPLARIRGEAELLVDSKGRADPQAVAGIREGTARMERIIETLLTNARTANAANQGRCAVSEAIAEAIDPSHADIVPIAIEVEPEDLHAGVDLQVCARIIAPIIDNATRFAESQIEVRAMLIDSRVCIDITNDGPAFSPNGAGLGLPLARRLAHAADGDVRLTSEEPVCFRIELPA
jgi:signal transduction histidine kinase